MSRLLRIALAAAAGAMVASLTACAPEPADPVELGAAECVAEAWNGGPLRSAVVDCGDPHLFDVVASLGEWPGTREAIEADGADARSVYERIVRADPGDELADGFHAWAEPRCAAAFDALLGFDTVTVGGRDGGALGLRIHSPGTLVTALSTREQFELGDHTALCAVAWPEADGTFGEVSYPAGATVAALAGPGLAPEQRECFDLEGDGQRSEASCAGAHRGQVIVDVDARAALGDDWVAEVDPATGRSRDYDTADELCQTVLEQLLPAGALSGERRVWADLRPTDGWVGFDGSVEDRRYPLTCAVIAPEHGDTIDGDLWG